MSDKLVWPALANEASVIQHLSPQHAAQIPLDVWMFHKGQSGLSANGSSGERTEPPNAQQLPVPLAMPPSLQVWSATRAGSRQRRPPRGWVENAWGGAGAQCSGEKTCLCTRPVRASVRETLEMKRNGKVPGEALRAGLQLVLTRSSMWETKRDTRRGV